MLKLLAFGAEQDDIVLILHMDRWSINPTICWDHLLMSMEMMISILMTILFIRRDHLVMSYAQQLDRFNKPYNHYHHYHDHHCLHDDIDQERSFGDELRSAVRPTLYRGAGRARQTLVSFDDMINHAEC